MENHAAGHGPPIFHGLLHVDRGERHINLSGAADPVDIYAACAAACARSFAARGVPFRLITNEAELLAARYRALSLTAPDLVEHRFTRDIPAIPFRSAHRKLEVFALFAQGRCGPSPALVDIDTLLLRPLSLTPVRPGTLYGYDITSQVVPAYGEAAVGGDLRAIAGEPSLATRWWGGEFLAGDVAAFAALSDRIEQLWPTYLAAIGSLHHVGDEALTSAAVGLLAAEGAPVVDLGGDVQRWWSNRTIARQPATLREALASSLLHLPADKPFLARYAAADRDLASFSAAYRRYVATRLPAHRLAALVARLRGQPRHYVPRLA